LPIGIGLVLFCYTILATYYVSVFEIPNTIAGFNILTTFTYVAVIQCDKPGAHYFFLPFFHFRALKAKLARFLVLGSLLFFILSKVANGIF